MLPKIKFKIYSSPKTLVYSYYKKMGLKVSDLRKSKLQGITDNGTEIEYTLEQQLDGIQEMGIWGYADIRKNTIHYWHDKNTSFQLLLKLLGHEVGHIILKSRDNSKYYEIPEENQQIILGDGLLEEYTCDDFGDGTVIIIEHLNKRGLIKHV